MNVKLTESVGKHCFRGESDGAPVSEVNVPTNSTSGAKVGDVVEVRNIGAADKPRYVFEKIVEVGPALPKPGAPTIPVGMKYTNPATNPDYKQPAHGKKQ